MEASARSTSSFRVSYASKPGGATPNEAHKRQIMPRTDIDMNRQAYFAQLRAQEKQITNIEDRDEAGVLPPNERRAILIQLVHEARRYQQERLNERGVTIQGIQTDFGGVLLTKRAVENFINDISALMTPSCPIVDGTPDNYLHVLGQIGRFGWFMVQALPQPKPVHYEI